MKMSFKLFVFLVTAFTIHIVSAYFLDIKNELNKYFHTENFRSFQNQWNKYKKSIESAAQMGFKENMGQNPMNIYIRPEHIPFVSKGLYYSDNIVDIFIIDIMLYDMPHVNMDSLHINLAMNNIQISCKLGKMFLDSRYGLLRNHSVLLYAGQKANKSPFAERDIREQGQLVITVENCKLDGFVTTKLNWNSADVGQHTLRITDCQYSVEIPRPGLSSPPVIAPYLAKSERLDVLLMKSLERNVMPRLQGVLYSYLNTTAIFGDAVGQYGYEQYKILLKTKRYMTELVRNINERTVHNNKSTLKLDNWKVKLDVMNDGRVDPTWFELRNVTLSGVDTAYSAQMGNPLLSASNPYIIEAIKFGFMLVHGELLLHHKTTEGLYFAAELRHVTAYAVVTDTDACKLEIRDLGTMAFSTSDSYYNKLENEGPHVVVNAYLEKEIPRRLHNYLYPVFKNLISSKESVQKSNSVEK